MTGFPANFSLISIQIRRFKIASSVQKSQPQLEINRREIKKLENELKNLKKFARSCKGGSGRMLLESIFQLIIINLFLNCQTTKKMTWRLVQVIWMRLKKDQSCQAGQNKYMNRGSIIGVPGKYLIP